MIIRKRNQNEIRENENEKRVFRRPTFQLHSVVTYSFGIISLSGDCDHNCEFVGRFLKVRTKLNACIYPTSASHKRFAVLWVNKAVCIWY